MNIWEIALEKSVIVMAGIGSKKLEFETKVVDKIGTDIIVQAICNNEGVPLSFESDKIQRTLSFVGENELPYVWNDIIVKYINYKGQNYHKISQTVEGKRVNRRNNFRLFVGEAATLAKGVSSETEKVILKDISASGFGFVSSNDYEIGSESVRLMCNYAGTKLNLQGKIVRKEANGRGGFVYGCKNINGESAALGQFIAKQQREQMKNKTK